MSEQTLTTDVLIVGAGMAGLMAAHILLEQGLRVAVVDKGSSVGGRLATRRIGPGRADHGAQFFTVRWAEFQNWVDRWLAAGLVYKWSDGFRGSLAGGPDGHPRYATRLGMNNLAQHLSSPLEARGSVHVRARVTEIKATDNGWSAQDDTGFTYFSRAVLLTPPVPQSLALLDQVPLPLEERGALEQIRYGPCLAGLFWVDGGVLLPEPGAIQRPDDPISWIADNRRKGISPDATIVTVHAGPDYSQDLWEVPERESLRVLEDALRERMVSGAVILDSQLKRWRYALPTTLHPERFLLATDLPPLAFAGDAFREPRVEGAALSGLAAGRALAAQLRQG